MSNAAKELFDSTLPLTMLDRANLNDAKVHKAQWDPETTESGYTEYSRYHGDGVINQLERMRQLEEDRILHKESTSSFDEVVNSGKDLHGMLYFTPVFTIPTNASTVPQKG